MVNNGSINNESERNWKEAVIIEVISQPLLEKAKENQINLIQDSRCSDWYSNLVPPNKNVECYLSIKLLCHSHIVW
jgi:hypothetical protein